MIKGKIIHYKGLKKSHWVELGTSRFSCWAENVPCSLAQWVRAQESHPLTKSLTKMSKKWQQASKMSEMLAQKGHAAI